MRCALCCVFSGAIHGTDGWMCAWTSDGRSGGIWTPHRRNGIMRRISCARTRNVVSCVRHSDHARQSRFCANQRPTWRERENGLLNSEKRNTKNDSRALQSSISMPILQQIQSLHSPPPCCARGIGSSSSAAAAAAGSWRPFVRSTSTRDLVATERARPHSRAVMQSVTRSFMQGDWIRDDGFGLHRAVGGELETAGGGWSGLRSDARWRQDALFGGRISTDWKMAASKVASPVLYKLDSIPNDVPVAAIAAENRQADAKRNSRLIVMGHRGCGKNNALSIGDVPGTRLSVAENTIRSFNLAASNGADYAEFDVQVTKDGHPVIFHDDLILSGNQASKIGDLTLEEFLTFGPQKDGKARKSLLRSQKDGTVKPWTSTLEDSLCTLKDAFELVEPSMGFNIEVKFHDTNDTPEHELRRVISAVLADVEIYGSGRAILFSSFHPDAAILLRHEQNSYPVLMLTDGGIEHTHADPRRNSVEAAIDVCVQNGLQGIVSEVFIILEKPQLVSKVKNAGLSLFTYGDINNLAEALVQQYNLNVDGVIVDCVREIVTASRTLHALLNFVQPDWSRFIQKGIGQDIKVK